MIPCRCGTLGRPDRPTEIAALGLSALLGDPARRMILQSSGEAPVFRSIWNCGCVVDFVDGTQPALVLCACREHGPATVHLDFNPPEPRRPRELLLGPKPVAFLPRRD